MKLNFILFYDPKFHQIICLVIGYFKFQYKMLQNRSIVKYSVLMLVSILQQILNTLNAKLLFCRMKTARWVHYIYNYVYRSKSRVAILFSIKCNANFEQRNQIKVISCSDNIFFTYYYRSILQEDRITECHKFIFGNGLICKCLLTFIFMITI